MPTSEPAHLLIGTPAYGGMVHVEFVNSLSSYHQAGIAFRLMALGNESLITRARNTILSTFFHAPEFSHLLFLDGDVHLPAEALARLIGHGVDAIAAPVPMKYLSPRGERRFSIGDCLGERGALYEVTRAATAALLLSRRAVTALVEEAVAQGRTYRLQTLTPGSGAPLPEQHYDVFQVGVVEGEYLSEDFWVCRRLRELGFSIYVDPAAVTRHHGMTVF